MGTSELATHRPKLSLGSWAFSFGPFETDPWPFDKVCRYAAEAGYDGVEINGFRPHPHPGDYETSNKRRDLKRRIAGYGLGISGYAPDFRALPPSEVSRRDYLLAIDQCLAFCGDLGIKTLRVDTVTPPQDFSHGEYEASFQRLASTWRQAAGRCQRADVTLVWEYEPGFWLNKPSEVKRLVEEVAHPHFKLLFDTSHSYSGAVVGARQIGEKEILPDGIADYARLLAPHVGHLHLIDADGSLHDGTTSAHLPFGQGRIDFPGVLRALSPVPASLPWWCLDFCFCPTTEVDARKALPLVRKMALS